MGFVWCFFFSPKSIHENHFFYKIEGLASLWSWLLLTDEAYEFQAENNLQEWFLLLCCMPPQMALPPIYSSLCFLFNNLTTHLSVGYAQYYSEEMGGIIQAASNSGLPFLSFSSLRVFLLIVCEVYATICIQFHLLFRDTVTAVTTVYFVISILAS